MISRHSQIRQLVDLLALRLADQPAHLQKIYSTSRYLSFQMRMPGKSFYLHIGRGGGYEGIWIGDTSPPSKLRLRDTWLEWCRKNLTSTLWQNINVDLCDRAICLEFRRAGEVLHWYVFWAGRTSYFAFHRPDGWFLSWREGSSEAQGFAVFDEVGRRSEKLNDEVPPPIASIDELWKKESEQLDKQQLPPKARFKSIETKIRKIEEDLFKIRQWKSAQDYLHNLDPETLSKDFRFESLRYKFPAGLGAWQKKEWLYGQLKRLKLADGHQQKRLEEAQQALLGLNNKPVLEESNLKPVKPVWKSMTAPASATQIQEDDYTVQSFDGFKIGLGLSAKGNDQLRKLWAKSEDWWVHAASGTSAHAVIKMADNGSPTPAQINQAARLIAKQSGITATQLEVVMTMIKNVRGVSGAPGMVTYKKNKTLLCDLET